LKKKKELHFRFHDPNTPEVAGDFLFHLFLEANQPKVDRLLHDAAEQDTPEPAEQESSMNSPII